MDSIMCSNSNCLLFFYKVLAVRKPVGQCRLLFPFPSFVTGKLSFRIPVGNDGPQSRTNFSQRRHRRKTRHFPADTENSRSANGFKIDTNLLTYVCLIRGANGLPHPCIHRQNLACLARASRTLLGAARAGNWERRTRPTAGEQ